MLNPSNSSPAISTEVRVEIPLPILGLSAFASDLVKNDIDDTVFNNPLSTEGNMYCSNPCSCSSLRVSISMITKRSNRALSSCLVAVYSLPMLAVETKHTPSATLIVACPSCSSNLRYRCPWSNTVIKIFQASGWALVSSSSSITAFGVCIAFTNRLSEK